VKNEVRDGSDRCWPQKCSQNREINPYYWTFLGQKEPFWEARRPFLAPNRRRKGAKKEKKTNRNKDQLLKTVFERLRHHFAPFWEPSEPRKWCWRVGLVTFLKFFVFSFSEATFAECCPLLAPFLRPKSIPNPVEITKVGRKKADRSWKASGQRLEIDFGTKS